GRSRAALTPWRQLLGGPVGPGSRGRLPCCCPAPKSRTSAATARPRFDLPGALWQDRREMRGAFIRAVPRQEAEPRPAMTENGRYVAYAPPRLDRGQAHPPELLPRRGAVHRRRVVEVLRHRLHGREKRDAEER